MYNQITVLFLRILFTIASGIYILFFIPLQEKVNTYSETINFIWHTQPENWNDI